MVTPINRWWIYQRERFPILAHGLLIAAFSFSAVAVSSMLRGIDRVPPHRELIVAFVSCFLFFLQLRIADEFKDIGEDTRFRPYRPVPRGLVTLRELGAVFIIAGIIQLALALWLDLRLVILLAITWSYLALMSKEFFIRDWLKHRPIIYMVSHMAIMPLVDLYATSTDWLHAGTSPPRGLGWFLMASFFNGMVIEIGRKIRSPADEETGVETYSALWGRKRAIAAFIAVIFAAWLGAGFTARPVGFVAPIAAIFGFMMLLSTLVCLAFLRNPTPGRGKWIEKLSGLWTLALYLGLGAAPLIWKVVTHG